MLKAHKIRLYPSREQEEMFVKACGIRRYAYNWMIALCERHKGIFGKYPNVNEVAKRFRKRRPEWTSEFGCYVYEVTDEVKQSIKKVIANRKNRLFSRPRFASRRDDYQSFYVHNRQLKTEGTRAMLSAFGGVRMSEPVRFPGKIMGARVSKSAGRWYLSIQIDTLEKAPAEISCENFAGIDLGYGVLATISDGRQYQNPAILSKKLDKLGRLQRVMARKRESLKSQGINPDNSRRHQKIKLKVQRLHAEIADTRSNATHNATADIAARYGGISLEGYDVAALLAAPRKNDETARIKTMRNRKMADANIGELRRQLQYKFEWSGKPCVKLPKTAKTNITCHVCGEENNSVILDMAEWECPACGTINDRRLNAAVNAARMAMRPSGV